MKRALLIIALLLVALPAFAGDGVPGNCPPLWPLEIRVLGPGQAGGESTRAEVAIEGNHTAPYDAVFVTRVWITEYIPVYFVHQDLQQVWQHLLVSTLYNSEGPYVVAQACFYYRKHLLFETKRELWGFIQKHFAREH